MLRFSEASFIKELEAQGVGRPSTYASIIGTLRTRTYVNMQASGVVVRASGRWCNGVLSVIRVLLFVFKLYCSPVCSLFGDLHHAILVPALLKQP